MNTNTGELHENAAALRDSVPRSHMMEVTPTPYQRERMKIGRNDACPCGSGLKFKKCHLGKPADYSPAK